MAELAPRGFSLATDVADWLVRQRVPVAQAHEISGAAVRYCEARGLELTDLTADDLPSIDSRLTPEVVDVLSVAGSIASRNARGGTAQAAVEQQLREVNDAIDSINDWLPTAPVPSQGESQPIGYWTAERPDA